MSKNTMKNIWKDKQKDEDRLNKLRQKKSKGVEKPEAEAGDSTDTSTDSK